jgi:hypothetical protein
MKAADDIAQFLASRRAKLTPEQAGLPNYGRRRPGLRLALYTAEADSPSQQALNLLASWAATPDPAEH